MVLWLIVGHNFKNDNIILNTEIMLMVFGIIFLVKEKYQRLEASAASGVCNSNKTESPPPPSVDSTVQFVQDVCSTGWSSSNVLTCATGSSESQNTWLLVFKCRQQQKLMM
jgi:hypothetical protein